MNPTRPRRRLGLFPTAWALLAAELLVAGPLAAQAANERPVKGGGPVARHPEAAKAIDHLKSPYCPGLMLEVCPSSGGQALRDSVQMLAEQGWAADSIVDWVVANHGEQYRALPKTEGKSLVLAWIIPPLGVLLGLALMIVVLRHMRAASPKVVPLEGDLTAEQEERLRTALREMDADEEASFF